MKTHNISELIILFCIGVICVAYAYAILNPIELEKPVPKQHVEREHLPTKCREFYNDGTDRWAKCMRVERK